jgi:alanyl-tRNA synthetase
MRTASQVRSEFLEFFRERGHRVVPSAPVILADDPTLFFVNAGMNQFKDVFLGTGRREYTRAADTQKVIRVSGKHNDLEAVGRDTYHQTFFEMLGNWSFGDYYKREAIAWAWELLTGVWGVPKDRLWATVYGGDPAAGIPPDEEAEALWRELTDIAPDHIVRLRANFWEMGETGPCGPCSEIVLDRGRSEGGASADESAPPDLEDSRFIELWNLVFIQFDRQEDGSLRELPARHVDTGMGFERILAVLQGKESNYDTDLFEPIFDRIKQLTGQRYEGSMEDRDVAFRVVADHVRALTAAFADGALPGNEGAGYVLRRILRRAARFGRQFLGQEEPFIYRLVPTVADLLGDPFPEMRQRQDHVARLIEHEEADFARTLDRGIALFDELSRRVRSSGASIIPGEEAYNLYSTYGFPRDLVELMAREQDLLVDEEGWRRAEELHRDASRGAGMGRYLVDPSTIQGLPSTRRLHYAGNGQDGLTGEATILRGIGGTTLVLDQSPFYPEAGGQVGDQGWITGRGFQFRVRDTQKMGDIVLHLGEVVEGDPTAPPDRVEARVDTERRLDTMANHSATHLLHWALKSVLGPHASQQGSLVAPDRLRFDFTHPKSLTLEEIERIERMVNERVAEDTLLQTTIEELQEARARGVTALFGEKYEERVRVVNIGGYSQELCGGTHCRSTGQIGAFVIVGETAVQAGVRRLEAVTRGAAIQRVQEQRRTIRDAAQLLKSAEGDVLSRIQALQEQVKELRRGGTRQAQADLSALARQLIAEAEQVDGARLISRSLEGVASRDLATLCDALRGSGKSVCGVVGTTEENRVALAAFASKDLAGKRVNAGQVVKEISPIVGGGGGGRPEFAQAGGRDASRLSDALARGAELLRQALS